MTAAATLVQLRVFIKKNVVSYRYMNKMMDLKEIIKWFIPCFHILLYKKVKLLNMCQLLCLLLFFAPISYGAHVNVISDNSKSLDNYNKLDNSSKSEKFVISNITEVNEERSLDVDMSVGRTFGRPFKKMAQALIPLSFQIGAASTWMVVAALIGMKTLMVALVILKLLLIAAAAKMGAFFAQKTQAHAWQPPHQKEIHLHIHGQNGPHEEHISPWSRDGVTDIADTKNANFVVNPYSAGPQTISTPFGNYVKIDSAPIYSQGLSKLST